MLSDRDTILVRALAASDALRVSVRDYGGNANANRAAGLALLATHGVPVRVGGDAETRKTGERLLTEMAGAGLVEVNRHGRDRFPYVKLTPMGDARARALCDIPGRDAGRRFLAAVVENGASYPDTIGGRWVPELAFTGGRGWGAAATREDRVLLANVEMEFLPAASAGWVDTGSSLGGNTAYTATPAGLAELAHPANAPDVGLLPEPSDAALELYRTAQDAKLRELHVNKPRLMGDIGPTPLIACLIAYEPTKVTA